MKKIIVLATIGISLWSCCNQKQCTKNKENATKEATSNEVQTQSDAIPFQLATSYFVKNTYKTGDLTHFKITSQEKFESIFGMATTMGPNGTPTPIDFNKQFVIVLIGKETRFATDYVPESLLQKDGGMVFRCQIKESEQEQSFTTVPSIIAIVDKKYDTKLDVELFQVK